MYDFFYNSPDDIYYSSLAKRAKFLKEDPKGVQQMSKIPEEMLKEYRAV